MIINIYTVNNVLLSHRIHNVKSVEQKNVMQLILSMHVEATGKKLGRKYKSIQYPLTRINNGFVTMRVTKFSTNDTRQRICNT